MRSLGHGFKRGFEATIRFQKYLGWICILAMMSIMVGGTVFRYCFNAPWVFTEELVKSLYIPLSFLPLAYIARARAHIRVDLILGFLPKKIVDWLDVSTLFFVIVFSTVISYSSWFFIKRTLDGNLVLETIPGWSKLIFQIPMLFGIILLLLWAIVAFIQEFHKMIKEGKL